MKGSDRPKKSGLTALVALLLLGSPVLYVLSMGPVVALVERTGRGREVAEKFYAPVIWLHDNTPLEKPLEHYGRLWGWN